MENTHASSTASRVPHRSSRRPLLRPHSGAQRAAGPRKRSTTPVANRRSASPGEPPFQGDGKESGRHRPPFLPPTGSDVQRDRHCGPPTHRARFPYTGAFLLAALLCACALADPIIIEPAIDARGTVNQARELDLTRLSPAELARAAATLSTRLNGPALTFRTAFTDQRRLLLRVTRASVGGATLQVTVGPLQYQLLWPPAPATHVVDRELFVPIPAGEQTITVAAPAGTVIITRYSFVPDDGSADSPEVQPLPSGTGNQWRSPSAAFRKEMPPMQLPVVPPGLNPTVNAPGWPYNLSPHDTGMIVEDVWPALLFGPECVEEMRRKIEALPWAKAAFEQMRTEAEAVLVTEPVQPIEPVGWRHDFYSRATGEHLVYDPASPGAFLDPLSGLYEMDPAQHKAWVLFTHERTHRLMRSLGFLYALTGDERYARWVADGMRRAVEMFCHRELREGNNTEALYFQPLYDAPALIMLCDAYSLTRKSAAYTEDDHRAILQGIFEEGIPYQIKFLDKTGVHNMTCYVAAALARVGLEFDRKDWLERGLYAEKCGLRDLVLNGAPAGPDGEADGFWYEGTMFYHHYSLLPLITLFEIDRRVGGKVASDSEVRGRLEQMFAAPVELADQSLRLPTLGDLGAPKVMSVPLYRHLYEYAAGRLNPERFGPTLAAIYAHGIPRNSLAALAYGPDTLPGPRFPAGDTLMPRPGFGVLRRNTAEGPWYLLFKSGPHGAGHDHPDKLEFALNALGQIISPDPGTAGYALKDIHPFYRSTFSHNTLFVDERDQATVKDASLTWRPDADPAYARGVVRDAYPGVTLTRHLWFVPPYVVIVDRCSSDTEHRYGWLFHAYGSLTGRLTDVGPDLSFPAPGLLERYLTGVRKGCTSGFLDATWRVTEGVGRTQSLWLRLLATSDGPFEATLGRVPGNPIPDDFGLTMLRAAGTTRHFFTVLEVFTGAPHVALMAPEGDGVAVTLADGTVRHFTPAAP